jgi:multicomponent Na+:H+ antiporter subunit F
VTVIATICIAVLALAALGAVIRTIVAPGLPDKMVALDATLALAVNALALFAVLRDDRSAADLMLAATLLGGIGALTVARFVERSGS